MKFNSINMMILVELTRKSTSISLLFLNMDKNRDKLCATPNTFRNRIMELWSVSTNKNASAATLTNERLGNELIVQHSTK